MPDDGEQPGGVIETQCSRCGKERPATGFCPNCGVAAPVRSNDGSLPSAVIVGLVTGWVFGLALVFVSFGLAVSAENDQRCSPQQVVLIALAVVAVGLAITAIIAAATGHLGRKRLGRWLRGFLLSTAIAASLPFIPCDIAVSMSGVGICFPPTPSSTPPRRPH